MTSGHTFFLTTHLKNSDIIRSDMPKVHITPPKEEFRFRSTLHKWRKIFRAIFARVILCGHSWVAISLLAVYVNTNYFILIGVSFLFYVVETGIILHFRSGLEWKRFCTPFLVYLLAVIPTLWVLRLNPGCLNSTRNCTVNATNGTNTSTIIGGLLPNISTLFPVKEQVMSDLVQQMPDLLQQSMMFVLILCRWLLPRGHIDRNSLSQLLIMYSAIGADILDFSEILTEDLVQQNTEFLYIVMAIWSWSLLQFTLVVTTTFTFRRHARKSTIDGESGVSATESVDKSEILSILMVFFMQDGPFLFVRCYAIIGLKMNQYLTIFFSLKNLLALILGLYRLVVICGCVEKEGNDLLTMEEIAKSTQSLDVLPSSSGRKTRKDKRSKH